MEGAPHSELRLRASRAERWARCSLVVAVVVTFWPALLGSYVADDLRLLAADTALRSGDLAAITAAPMFDVKGGYWRPLTMLVLFAGDSLGGAFGVHGLALLLHAMNALAVRALARRFVSPAAATWAAMLFVVHPVQVESVAWCSAINDPLWVLFALQAMLAVARWHEAGRRGMPWLAGVCALAALLAKEPGVAAMPLAAAMAWALPRPSASEHAPRSGNLRLFFTLGLAAAIWLAARAAVHHETPGRFLVAPRMDPFAGFSPSRAFQTFAAQLGLLVWPWPTHCMRSLPHWAAWDWRAFAGLLAAAASALAVARVRRAARVTATLLVAPLLPVLLYTSVIGTYPIADRYLYASVAGLGLGAAAVLRERLPRARWLLPAVLATTSFWSTWNWHDSESLTRQSLACAPNDPMVLVMAADLDLERGFAGEPVATVLAASTYRRALALAACAPRSEQLRRAERKAALGLAWCTLLRHRDSGASAADVITAFRTAVDRAPDDPMAWLGLGAAHLELRQPAEAERAFAEALRLDPSSRAARSGLLDARARARR